MATITGTSGDDPLVGTDDSDIIFALDGQDIIDGGIGNDSISGGPGHDVIYDGSGNDTCFGNEGINTVYADASDLLGNDRFIGTRSQEMTVVYSAAAKAIAVDLAAGFARGRDIGWDRLIDVIAVKGGAGNDILRGDDKQNAFGGDAGDDHISGRGGDDYVWGAAGNDRLGGGPGNDMIVAGLGYDTIIAGDGDDNIQSTDSGTLRVYCGAGDDLFQSGSTIHDTISGGSGDDRILAMNGGEVLSGDEGADRFYLRLDPFSRPTLIQDFEDGVDKLGTISLEYFETSGHAYAKGVYLEGPEGLLLIMRGVSLAQIDASDFV